MSQVTVDLNRPSLYAEPDSRLYRLKRRLTFRHVMKWLRRAAAGRRDFKLLEVGTGSGYFATFVEHTFPDAQIVGIEYDPRLVALAQSKLRRATVLQGNAEELDRPDASCDIVVSLQVIEHLYHPERMLKQVHRVLREGGTFIFTTPNLDGFGARWMGQRWHARCEDHVSLKGVDEWRRLVESHGFTPVYIGSTFFSGVPWLNRLPLGLINWLLLLTFGSWPWQRGESFIGVFRREPVPTKAGL